MAAKTVAGSELDVYVKGVNVGFVTDVNITRAFSVQQVEAFGSDLIQEIRATGATCGVTFGHVYLIAQALTNAGVGLIPKMQKGSIVLFQPVDMTLVETATGITRFRITGCMPTSDTLAVGARTLAAENVTWACIAAFEGEDA